MRASSAAVRLGPHVQRRARRTARAPRQRLPRRRAALGPALDRPLGEQRPRPLERLRQALVSEQRTLDVRACGLVVAAGGSQQRAPARGDRTRARPARRDRSLRRTRSPRPPPPDVRAQDQRLDLVLDHLGDRELADPLALQLGAGRPQPGERLLGVAAAQRGEPERRLGALADRHVAGLAREPARNLGVLARLLEAAEMGEHQPQRAQHHRLLLLVVRRRGELDGLAGEPVRGAPVAGPQLELGQAVEHTRAARLVAGDLHAGRARPTAAGGRRRARPCTSGSRRAGSSAAGTSGSSRAEPRARAHGPCPRAGTWSRAPRRCGTPRQARSRAATRRRPAPRTARPRGCGPPSSCARPRST